MSAVNSTAVNSRTLLIGLIAAVVLLGFCGATVLGFVASVKLALIGPDQPVPYWINNGIEGDLFVGLSTALSALVGGVAASGLGQPPPKVSGDEQSRSRTPSREAPPLSDQEQQLKAKLTTIYAIAFILLGALAVVAWLLTFFVGVWTPQIVRALSSVAIGLFLPVLSQFFGVQVTANPLP